MYYVKKTLVLIVCIILLSGCVGQKHVALKSSDEKTLEHVLLTNSSLFKSNNLDLDQLYKYGLTSNHYLINQDKSLEIRISEYGYTRFYIEDERITDVFIYPQEDLQVKIHQQGYLIIVPKSQINADEDTKLKEKIYLTITGEHGTTQDFFCDLQAKLQNL